MGKEGSKFNYWQDFGHQGKFGKGCCLPQLVWVEFIEELHLVKRRDLKQRLQITEKQYSQVCIFMDILVSQCCSNKSPVTGWLKIIYSYSFTVLGARSSKSRCQVGPCSLKFLGKNLSCLFLAYWRFLVFSGLQIISPIFASVFRWHSFLFVFLIRISVIRFKAHPNQYDLILPNYACKDCISK